MVHNDFFHKLFDNMIEIENLRENQIVQNNPANNKVAVIVEPRQHEFFEKVIRNAMFILPKNEWNLHIVTSKNNKEYIESLFPNWDITVSYLQADNLTIDEYNKLLMNEEFWLNINEENILIFQTDVLLFNKNIDDFIEYDFIGANFYDPNHISLKNGGNNGGFSFRHKSAMLDCVRNLKEIDIKIYFDKNNKAITYNVIPEDIFFSSACEILNKKLCPVDERKKFSIEEGRPEYNQFYERPVGCHRFNSPEIDPIIMELLKASPYTSQWL